ncbi:hypothetical protein EAS68_04105 [Legionella jordanis]|nr:hypothetical protein EAS68_04105 [Legionella jordanis]
MQCNKQNKKWADFCSIIIYNSRSWTAAEATSSMGQTAALGEVQDGTIFPVKQQDGTVIHYFCDYSEFLGEGSSGDIYKAYPCILKDNRVIDTACKMNRAAVQLDSQHPVAIKIYKNDHSPSPYRLKQNSILLTINDRLILIMPYIEGFSIKPELNENVEIRTMSFFQAVDLAWQLIISLNQLHYNNSSGPPTVHGDISGDNIRIRCINGKYEAHLIDDDFNKLILPTSQIAQGTPEHLAVEVLDGFYSEASDFYALTPILYSLFGAFNPFKNILKFRESHRSLPGNDLIRFYNRIGFCGEGLFGHFEPKPQQYIAQMLSSFLKQMSAEQKDKRPSPEAILEFFTALRQYCLFASVLESTAIHQIRMAIASQDLNWMNNSNLRALFFNLDDNVQHRLIQLMWPKACRQLILLSSANERIPELVLKKALIDVLRQLTLSETAGWPFLFRQNLPHQELKWLLYCFEEHRDDFFSSKGRQFIKTLENLKQPDLKPIIVAVIARIKEGQPIQYETKNVASLAAVS